MLESEKIFVFNAVRLVQYLTPPVLACGFCAEEYQILGREDNVVIGFSGGEDKVRTLVAFCDNLLLVVKAVG